MEITKMNVNDLTPYEYNNRKHGEEQVALIAKSIEEFGFNQPIVVDENNEIIVGHGRQLAAIQLGLKTVPVQKVHNLTDDQKRAYRILDNKTQEDSSWFWDNLGLELDFLEEVGWDLEEWGMDDLKEILDSMEDKDIEENLEESDVPDTRETDVKHGDIITLGKHRLMCGDSTVLSDVDKLMDGSMAYMVFTDPPYNVDYGSKSEFLNMYDKADKSDRHIKNDKMKDEEFKAFLDDVYKNLYTHTIEGGAIYVCHADSESINFKSCLMESGFIVKQCIIWIKNNFILSRQDYHWQHEPILYGWKDGSAHNWHGDRKQSTIWEVDKPQANKVHPTMKPIALIGKALVNSSRKKDIVLDLFLGSGSTLMACEQLGRVCYGMELDPKYCQVIIDRYLEYKPNAKVTINGEKYEQKQDTNS